MGSEICYFCSGVFVGIYFGYSCKKNDSTYRPNRIVNYSPNQPEVIASQPQVAQPCDSNLNNEMPEAHTIVI
tara:strand:- start:363 stop:578 length:216 start_codon:yes stop_codon:yes gene_type:complete